MYCGCLFGYTVDGDGIDDIAVIALNVNKTYYIGFMNADDSVREWSVISPSSDPFLAAASIPQQIAYLAGIGDINHDGVADLAIGDPLGAGGSGVVHICLLNRNATCKEWLHWSNETVPFLSANLIEYNYFGHGISRLGDIGMYGWTPVDGWMDGCVHNDRSLILMM